MYCRSGFSVSAAITMHLASAVFDQHDCWVTVISGCLTAAPSARTPQRVSGRSWPRSDAAVSGDYSSSQIFCKDRAMSLPAWQ